jgi:hypothetical protein
MDVPTDWELGTSEKKENTPERLASWQWIMFLKVAPTRIL